MSFSSTIILLLLVVCRFTDVKNGTMIISNFSRLFAPIKALVSISDTDEHIANSFRLGADYILTKRKDEKTFLDFFIFDGFDLELYNKGKEWALK